MSNSDWADWLGSLADELATLHGCPWLTAFADRASCHGLVGVVRFAWLLGQVANGDGFVGCHCRFLCLLGFARWSGSLGPPWMGSLGWLHRAGWLNRLGGLAYLTLVV